MFDDVILVQTGPRTKGHGSRFRLRPDAFSGGLRRIDKKGLRVERVVAPLSKAVWTQNAGNLKSEEVDATPYHQYLSCNVFGLF